MDEQKTKRWEYVRIQSKDHRIKDTDATVDKLGHDGWELTGVIHTETFIHLWFKRPK